jgi:hypothetical protein
LKAGKLKPEITYIDEAIMKGADTVRGGDVLVLGSSQPKPYEPIFGYRLENFPKKSLVPGTIDAGECRWFSEHKKPGRLCFSERKRY